MVSTTRTTNGASTTSNVTSTKRKFASDDREEFNAIKRSRKLPQKAKPGTSALENHDPNKTSSQIFTPASRLKKPALTKHDTASKTRRSQPTPTHPPLPVINEAPTQVLKVIVFGTGECGELGLGPRAKEVPRPVVNPFLDASDAGSFPVVQLDCGGMHTIALTKDNKIITWGVNDNGALGRDTTWNSGLRDIDAESDDESVDLNPLESTPAPVPADYFPQNIKFVQVAAGDSCSFALTDTGRVYGWGTFVNNEGKTRFIYHNKRAIEVQRKPLLIPGLQNITQITCGANHALALDDSGNVWAWGVGEQNQLGRRILERRYLESFYPHRVEVCRNNAKYIASGLYHSFAVDRKDNVWAWGLNGYCEAGYAKDAGNESSVPAPMKIPDLRGKGVTVLDGGAHHSAAITADGQCLVWGRIDGGQLGIEFSREQLEDDTLIRRDERNRPRICLRPTAVVSIGNAVYVGCGTDHTIFVNKEGKAFGAGFGSMGQLGIASCDDAEVAEQITGKAVKDMMLTWCGAGGQFSIVAAPSGVPNGS
ncbi:hypothetical protein DL769_000300 [Monosporascus sp. CRB-8-3]|nr:hypothetical protein DL769_000300 [Monosporascus sp. CRB-8-3]